MFIIIIKFPCEIIILQIYDRNKYYIIEVPDVKGVLKRGTNHAITLKFWQNHASRLDIWIVHVSRLSAWIDYRLLSGTSCCQLYMLKTLL
jgi:hypothetical protein